MTNTYNPQHPHEPRVAVVLDEDGGCLVCGIEWRLERLANNLAAANERLRGLEAELAYWKQHVTDLRIAHDEALDEHAARAEERLRELEAENAQLRDAAQPGLLNELDDLRVENAAETARADREAALRQVAEADADRSWGWADKFQHDNRDSEGWDDALAAHRAALAERARTEEP